MLTLLTQAEFMEYVESVMRDMIVPKLPQIFDFVVTWPIEFVNSPFGGLGFYSDPSADGSRPGRVLVNAQNYAERYFCFSYTAVL